MKAHIKASKKYDQMLAAIHTSRVNMRVAAAKVARQEQYGNSLSEDILRHNLLRLKKSEDKAEKFRQEHWDRDCDL